MNQRRRTRLYIDRKVQRAIMMRVCVYWLFCMMFVMTPVVVIRVLTHWGEPLTSQLQHIWNEYWLAFIFATLLLPMALTDALRLSHGFIGPMIRLRRELAIQAKERDDKFPKFRDGDFWNALAVDVDEFTDELERTTRPVSTNCG